MKVLNYIEFLNEVKRSKLNFFLNGEVSKLFTCSIEIELETDDTEGVDEEYSEEYKNEIFEKIINSVTKELYRKEGFEMNDEISDFLENVIEECSYEIDDYDYVIDNILDSEQYESDNYKSLIIEIIKQQVLTYFFSDNFEYLESKFKNNFSSFYSKYKNDIKFELDNTLDRGIEISNKSYFNDISDLIDFINTFYDEFNEQKYWKFSSNTGIHLNIGVKNTESNNYNIIKGLLFLNDQGEEPFVFKNLEWRKKSKFCGSLLSKLKQQKEIIKNCKSLLEDNKMSECENKINEELFLILRNEGYKNFGVNLTSLRKYNYIEFRYTGGQIDRKVLIDKLLYFCYVVYCMVYGNYNKKEYTKKLYKFLNSI
jgi:hypothetical protein